MARKIELILEGKDQGATALLDDVQGGLSGLEKDLKLIGTAAAAAFAAVAAGVGLAVKAAVDAEPVWAGLQLQLRNVGVAFNEVRGEIDAVADHLIDVAGIGDEDTARALTTLVSITKDYRGSLADLGLVADLAAAKDMDMVSAAQLVGRVKMGNSEILARYGIVVKDTSRAVEELRSTFRGFAEAEGSTVAGEFRTLRELVGEFFEELGNAIIGGNDFTDMLRILQQEMRSARQWVEDNRAGIQRWVAAAKGMVVEVINVARATAAWISEHRRLLIALGQVAAIAGLSKLVFDLGTAISTGLIPKLLSFARLIGPGGLVIGALAAVTAGFLTWRKAIKDTGADLSGFRESLIDLDEKGTRRLIDGLAQQKAAFEDAIKTTETWLKDNPIEVRLNKEGLATIIKPKGFEEQQKKLEILKQQLAGVADMAKEADRQLRQLLRLSVSEDVAALLAAGSGPSLKDIATPRAGVQSTTSGIGKLKLIRDVEPLRQMTARMIEFRNAAIEAGFAFEQFQKMWVNLGTQGFLATFQQIGITVVDVFSGVASAFRGLVGVVTSAIGDMMIAAGTQIVLTSKAYEVFKRSLLSFTGAGGIAAGLALIAAGAAMKHVAGRISNPSGGGGGGGGGGFSTTGEWGAAMRGGNANGGPITLVLEGEVWNFNSPQVQDRLASALQRISGRQVTVISRA